MGKDNIKEQKDLVKKGLHPGGRKIKSRKSQKLIIICIGVLVILCIPLLFLTGTAQYSLAYIKCGKAPISGTEFAASFTYQAPGDPNYHVGIFQNYYCTEEDAMRAGLRHYVDPTSL